MVEWFVVYAGFSLPRVHVARTTKMKLKLKQKSEIVAGVLASISDVNEILKNETETFKQISPRPRLDRELPKVRLETEI